MRSIFDLLGEQENDLTAALAFVLARSELLGQRFLGLLEIRAPAVQALQLEVADPAGRTDLEIRAGDALIVLEAKRGWRLPVVDQLERYVERIRAASSAGSGLLVTLSAVSDDFARLRLPPSVAGISVRHLSWAVVMRELCLATREARGRERMWLGELDTYLRRVVHMLDVADSWCYCVVVSNHPVVEGATRTSREWLIRDGVYSHVYGEGGWPTIPPNFIAFRWDGAVQQIRRVESAEVVPSLHGALAGVPATTTSSRPHVVYRLGQPLPGTPIPTGRNYRDTRLRDILLDQLLTSPTLADAIERSRALRDR